MSKLGKLEKIIGYYFNDKSLLKEALTHKSFSHENKLAHNYERLELMGDAVLQMVVTDYLYDTFPQENEGTLTKYRASLVSEQALSQRAIEMGINQYIRLGNGEKTTNGTNKPSILSDVMESLIGAIWKEGGYNAVKSFINRFILQNAEIINKDYKSRLFELLGDKLTYVTISEVGKDHEKIFTIAAVAEGKTIGTGTGRTKKEAEQEASRQALEKGIC